MYEQENYTTSGENLRVKKCDMQKKFVHTILVVLGLAVVQWGTVVELSARDLVVAFGSRVASIQAALSMAQPHDKIIVQKGVYKEGHIVIEKTVQLVGEPGAILDGEGRTEVLTVRADSVVVRGFAVQNTGTSSLQDRAGIRVADARWVVVENNRLHNTFFGIYLSGSKHCTVRDNMLVGQNTRETSSGSGIHLWKSDSCAIRNNTVVQHRDGIYFEFVTASRIQGNTCRNNIRYGLHFMFSDHNEYIGNVFHNNSAGVAVMYTRHITMRDNEFRDNWGAASYGLLLKDIRESEIVGNRFSNNTVGMYMEGSDNLQIHHNTFTKNGWAVRLMSNCSNDEFFQNNFLGNTFDVATNGKNTTNSFTRNYWDKYEGYDLNRDHIGDVPYRPVSLFSMVVEKIPNSILLLRSLFVDVLDRAEKAMPTFIPESLVDNQPRMQKVP